QNCSNSTKEVIHQSSKVVKVNRKSMKIPHSEPKVEDSSMDIYEGNEKEMDVNEIELKGNQILDRLEETLKIIRAYPHLFFAVRKKRKFKRDTFRRENSMKTIRNILTKIEDE